MKISALADGTAAAQGDQIPINRGGSNFRIPPQDLLSILHAAEISLTGATTATIGRMHVCSGTTADYTVTLPAASGNTGKFIGFRMATGLTKLVTLDGNASETIDGALTRVMWELETAILYCNGVNWSKVAGRSRPMTAVICLSASQNGIVTATGTVITLNTSLLDNTGGMVDTGNNRINIKRPATYIVAPMGRWSGISATAVRLISSAHKNVGSTQIFAYESSAPTGAYTQVGGTFPVALIAGDYVKLSMYQDTGVNQTAYGDGGGTGSHLQIIEIPQW